MSYLRDVYVIYYYSISVNVMLHFLVCWLPTFVHFVGILMMAR
jgi:hypothetical protein